MEIQHYTESTPESLTKIVEGWAKKHSPSFDDLSAFVLQTHQTAQAGAIRAINQMATLRNWLIGCYIVEYEQGGRDRAKYGDRLLKRQEEKVNTKGLNLTLFKVSRNFYLYYPQIAELFHVTIHPIQSDELMNEKGATLSHQFNNVGLFQKSATSSHQFITAPHTILSKLSFSHIREIMTQDDPLARFFYETECIKGTWSVKELRRQIATNLYFRSGVSKDPKKLLASSTPTYLIIRRTRCAMVTTLPSAYCSVPAKVRRWWNTPLLVWTTNSLSPPICSNSRTRARLKSSC